MALIRILVDGYSLLHGWPELAPRHPRHSMEARDELIRQLTLYRDATGIPISVIFDGGRTATGSVPDPLSTREMEVLYSPPGYTADDLIERATFRLLGYGEVLVVTDDLAERDTVVSMGAGSRSCADFIYSIQSELKELQSQLERYNHRERRRFSQRDGLE